MELHVDVPIPFARDVAFAAYRDDIVKLLPYLPNVRSIEVRSRKDEGDRVHIVNDWRGGGEIPGAVRALLGESALAWTDDATWDSSKFECAWRTQTAAFGEALRCSGTNSFHAEGPDRSRLDVRGTIDVDAKKIRGIPGFLAGKAGRAIEEFLVSRIQSNLAETAKGLTRYLEDHRETVTRG
jgi:hypothetical protein